MDLANHLAASAIGHIVATILAAEVPDARKAAALDAVAKGDLGGAISILG